MSATRCHFDATYCHRRKIAYKRPDKGRYLPSETNKYWFVSVVLSFRADMVKHTIIPVLIFYLHIHIDRYASHQY
jgi:hypothetical protein